MLKNVKKSGLSGAVMMIALMGCSPQETLVEDNPPVKDTLLVQLNETPIAKPQAYSYSFHGVTVDDPWHWLRDPDYPNTDDAAVLDYLNAENTYYQRWLGQHTSLTDALFEEFKGRVDETETSVPWIDNGYEYRWEYREGAEYRVHLRKPIGAADNEETVFLDENELAEDHEYFVLASYSISPDNRYLAYAFDTAGDERYIVKVKDLQTGQYLADEITDNGGSVMFASDGSLIYSALEEVKWRISSINRHELGKPVSQDGVLLAENDDAFFMGFGKTSDDAFLILGAGNSDVSEYYALPMADLSVSPILLASREHGFNYDVDHAHGKFWILANDQHVNFRLASVDSQSPGYENWQTVVAGSDKVYLKGLQTFKDYLAIKQSVDGLEEIQLRGYDGQINSIAFPEKLFTASLFDNYEFDQPYIRLNYQSMISPDTVFDYYLKEQRLEQRKVKSIPSGYDKSQYLTKRIMIEARDGVSVPVSLMYRRDAKFDGSEPLHLYGYGAYGSGMRPSFSTTRLSLVDRGVIYAIAHVRGGDEMGYQWYLDGKLTKRLNAFNDFVDVARGLIVNNYTAAQNISISGRSAGGELMGAAVIQAPELWSGVLLGVPFVDVLNTMLDVTLPLTPPEWREWGNPIEDKAAFELIKGYSPYDNIIARDYPPMMVTGGLNDPRVTYWEPAKWTASMRHHKTDDNLLVMRMNMGAGHFANSGRYGRLRDYAEEFTFILLSHGIEK
jgi:oligopeptidase B